MSKDSISKTAQVNLQMLARLGVPEAVAFRDALQLEGDPLSAFAHVPFARRIPLCVSCATVAAGLSPTPIRRRCWWTPSAPCWATPRLPW